MWAFAPDRLYIVSGISALLELKSLCVHLCACVKICSFLCPYLQLIQRGGSGPDGRASFR